MNVLVHLTDKFTTLTTAAPEGRFEKRLKIWASFEEGKVSMNGLQPRKSRAIAVSCSQLHNFPTETCTVQQCCCCSDYFTSLVCRASVGENKHCDNIMGSEC